MKETEAIDKKEERMYRYAQLTKDFQVIRQSISKSKFQAALSELNEVKKVAEAYNYTTTTK